MPDDPRSILFFWTFAFVCILLPGSVGDATGREVISLLVIQWLFAGWLIVFIVLRWPLRSLSKGAHVGLYAALCLLPAYILVPDEQFEDAGFALFGGVLLFAATTGWMRSKAIAHRYWWHGFLIGSPLVGIVALEMVRGKIGSVAVLSGAVMGVAMFGGLAGSRRLIPRFSSKRGFVAFLVVFVGATLLWLVPVTLPMLVFGLHDLEALGVTAVTLVFSLTLRVGSATGGLPKAMQATARVHPSELGLDPREDWAVDVVEVRRMPPRPVTSRLVLSGLRRERDSRLLYFIVPGSVPVVVAAVLGIAVFFGALDVRIFGGISIVVAVSSLLIAIWAVTRRTRWLRSGMLGTAVMADVEVGAVSESEGEGVSERRALVKTEDGRVFDSGVDLSETWMSQLDPGTRVVVLVDPRRDRVRWWLATEAELARAAD